MEYDSDKMRGVLDKSFASIKLPFHRDCTAQDMLRKCRENVWPGAKDTGHYRYSLADGSGTCIGDSAFSTDLPDGGKESLPWTLNNYFWVSNIKYASRMRLYCVRTLCTGNY